jgi:archaellum component FlaC
MTSLINLILLACAPIVVVYLAWRWQFPKGVTSDDRHQATNGQGERTMTGVMAGPDAAQVIRWIEESPTVFESVRRFLQEYNQVKEAAGAAQEECERLRQNCEGLREEVKRLQAETERVNKEQAESAQWLATVMREAASRFRIEQPPA